MLLIVKNFVIDGIGKLIVLNGSRVDVMNFF